MSGSARRAETGSRTPRGTGERWTVLRLIRWSGEYLEGRGVERGRLDAEHLLAYALGVDRMRLYLDFDRPLQDEELESYRPLLRRRAAREPLQYIVGRSAFRELELEVDPAVLIPRPETEVLVDVVLEWAKAQGRTDLRALDVGTGSGAIALALAGEGAFAEVVATDPSAEGLSLAARNAEACRLTGGVRFLGGSLFDPVVGEVFDAIVSNPPYVADGDLEVLEPEVRDWEPRSALAAGAEGLDVLGPLVAAAAGHLREGGLLAVEVGLGQASSVTRLAEEAGAYGEIGVRRDLTGRERIVLMHRR